MKKRRFLSIAASLILAATITACGSDSSKSNGVVADEVVSEVEEKVEEVAPSIDGAELFSSNACVACHQTETKTVGPAIKEIKEVYSGNSEGLIAFLAGEGDPIVDVAQAAVMAPQIETTKAMTPEERAALADFLLK